MANIFFFITVIAFSLFLNIPIMIVSFVFYFLKTNKIVRIKNDNNLKSVSYNNRNININRFALYMKLTLFQVILDTQR